MQVNQSHKKNLHSFLLNNTSTNNIERIRNFKKISKKITKCKPFSHVWFPRKKTSLPQDFEARHRSGRPDHDPASAF